MDKNKTQKLKKFLKKEEENKKENVIVSTEGELVETINKTIIIEGDGRELMFD